MKLLLGIDLGTSYFKVGLFGPDGSLRGLGRVPVPVERPAPGWVELPVSAFWALLRRGLREALAAAGVGPAAIAGVSYSSQANSFLLLDAGGEPLTPLVLWTDERAGELDPDLAELSASPSFTAAAGFRSMTALWAPAKWRWFQRHQPDTWARMRRIATISDYLAWALTGRWVGDAGTAALLGALDIRTGDWSDRALGAFGVTRGQLSEPLRPGSIGPRTGPAAERLLDLPRGLPFALGGLDHQVAAVGAGLGSAADACLSLGTVLAAVVDTTDATFREGCLVCPHVGPGKFVRLAFDPAGAGELEEFQRTRCPGRELGDLIAEAAGPAAHSGEAAEVRRILERIAATQAGLLARLAEGGVRPATLAATGGGARSADWMKFTATRLATRVVVPGCTESACLGAAVFAAVAAGWHPDVPAAAAAMVKAETSHSP